MPKISHYQIKASPLSAQDKWIGTDSSGNVTKNFSPESISTFINERGYVSVAGQASFGWQESAGDREAGTISLTGFGGDGSDLGDLTTFLISDSTAGGEYIFDYLNATVGQYIILVDVDDENNFVVGNITSLTPSVTYPGFSDLVWTVSFANGELNGYSSFVLANFAVVETLDDVATRNPVTDVSITTGGLTSAGNLAVSAGFKTTLSDDVDILDNFPLINSGQTGAPTENAGFLVHRGDEPTRGIRWEETEDRWEMQKSSGDWAPMGIESYLHDQGLVASTWTITHSLGKYPSCAVTDSGGTTIMGQVSYIDTNSLTITFVGAFSGKAYLN